MNAVSSNNPPLITNPTSPIVMNDTGIAAVFTIGPIKPLTTPKIAATTPRPIRPPS